MTRSDSLSSYFANTDAVTLDNCDKERIHLSDAIQAIGALLAVDPATTKIIAASENAHKLLALGKQDILALSLADISTQLADEIGELTHESQVLHEVLDYEVIHNDVHYDAVTHQHDGRRIIEFLPNNNPSAQSVRRKMRLCSKSCTRILKSDTFEKGMQIAVEAVREITGFSRAKIYQFLPDWSGKTVAESRDGRLESFLGLHFPSSDIPQQVRHIMLMVPYRAIGTVSDDIIPIIASKSNDDGEKLDLTWSLLRSVSTMHTEYCRNMGVKATFSCSLLHEDKLWGLIACHHDEQILLPFDSWSLIQEISLALMLRYDQQQRVEVSDMIYQLRLIENKFASEVRKNGDIEVVISMLIPRLQKFLGADGFAFQYGDKLHLSGSTPPPEFVKNLIQWAILQRETTDQFQTIALHKQWEPAREHMDTACGVLIQPITIHRVCQLIWFRGPITQRVEWAGKPVKRYVADDPENEPQRLAPRFSFERWIEEHSEQSALWQTAELESAREIFKEFLDIIASHVLLKEENDTLRTFTASAAHDIRAPLRGITMALDIMDEDNFEADSVRHTHGIAQRSAKRLTDLTAAILDLTSITEQAHKFESTNLNLLLRTVTELLDQDITDCNATIEINTLPTVKVNQGLISRLFLNLVSNSLKYAHPDRKPSVLIKQEDSDNDKVVISVTDNGIGIAHKQSETIFKPMQRLHAAEKIEGTGLGLTICKKVLEAHKGSIVLDASYSGGSRFFISLPNEV